MQEFPTRRRCMVIEFCCEKIEKNFRRSWKKYLHLLYYILLQDRGNGMREVMSISLEKSLKNKVEKTAERLHITRSDLVKMAIQKYIIYEELESIRSMLIPRAQKMGILDDEDVFREFS